MSTDVYVSQVNDVYLLIDCERSIAREMYDYFSFFVPNHQFMPKFKNKIWDGKIHLLNRNMTLYVGLLSHLEKFCDENDYNLVKDQNIDVPIDSKEELRDYINSLEFYNEKQEEITPYPEQIIGFVEGLHTGRRVIVSPTASGKSLIIYAYCHYLLNKEVIQDNKKILIIVPTIGLVNQMAGDFSDYSLKDENFDADNLIHKIMGGKEKNNHDTRIYISTWQSIYKQSRSYFDQFDAVIGDECHEYEAGSVQKILEKCIQCPVKIGLTGTLRDSKMNRLQVEGLFGPAIQITTIDKAIKDDRISKIDIRFQHLVYGREDHLKVAKMKYPDEIDWIVNNPKRNDFIASIALTRDDNENTLILVSRKIQMQLLRDRLMEIANQQDIDKDIQIVHGGTDADDRETIRKLIDKKTGVIIIATYGVFQRGINMKNLHNIIFGSPSKSLIRVLQSIGRGLRKASGKSKLVLWDLIDDIVQRKSKKNFSFEHGMERYKIYTREKLPFKVRKINFFDL